MIKVYYFVKEEIENISVSMKNMYMYSIPQWAKLA